MTTPRELERYRPRFHLLAALGPDVEKDASWAIRYAIDGDPAGSVAKCRRVTEAILKSMVPADTPKRDELTIHEMRARLPKGLLPSKAGVYVDVIQKLGNEGAHHRPEPVTPADAVQALGALHELADWYLHTHRRIRRPRSRARSVLLGLVAAAVLVFVLSVGLAAVAIPTAVLVTTTPPAPAPVASVVAPLPTPATVAPTVLAVPLWSRPWFPWEVPPASLTPAEARPGQPVSACAGALTNAMNLTTFGAWVRLDATCDAAPVSGWTPALALSAAPVRAPAQAPATYTPDARRQLQRANLALTAEEWTGAEAGFASVLALVPTDPALFEKRALARLRRGAPEAALDDLAVCLALAPKSGRCHLYTAEALQTIGGDGWGQVLADAVAHDPSLKDDAARVRAAMSGRDVRRVTGRGAGGLPLCTQVLKLGAARVKKILEQPAGTHEQEVCRLQDDDVVEVIEAVERGWYRVRARCDDGVREGYLPGELDGRATLGP